MGKDYLAHWGLSNVFDEAKVVRSNAGRFASSAADAAKDAADTAVETAGNLLDDSGNAINEVQAKAIEALKALFPTTTTVKVTTLDPVISNPNKFGNPVTFDGRIDDTGGFYIQHGDLDYEGYLLDTDGIDEVYLAHSGVKGMKWGVRRSSAALRSAAQARGAKPAKKEGEKESGGSSTKKSSEKPNVDPEVGVETSAGRYNRLAAVAKAGGAANMSDTDLKFFNARTEALGKIEKLNQTDPSWLSKTSKKVLAQTAEKSMQSISDAVASKYISGPITDAIKNAGASAED